MILLLLEAIVLYGSSWVLWRLFRYHFVMSSLENISGPPSKSLWKGVLRQIFNDNAWDFHKEITEKYGSVIKIKALLGENQLYIYDPKAMHQVVVKDQHIYEETTAFIEGNKVLFGPGLLGTLGDQHRKQRKLLTPVFSIAHMREMIPIFYTVTEKLRDAFAQRTKNGPQEIDVLKWMTRTALELIGQSGFGYSFDPLVSDVVPHPYSTSVKNLSSVQMKFFMYRTYFLPSLVRIGTPRFWRFIVDLLPWKDLHQFRDIVDILHNTSVDVIQTKKRILADGDEDLARQIGRGKDILSILLKANMQASEEERLSDEELLAQMSTLTFAAMDTTSAALARILHLLSIHQDVQEKLRSDILEATNGEGKLDYDQLVGLPYLDAVCRETLRLYPPVSMVSRTSRQDAVLPLSNPIKGLDGQEMHEIFVPKDTSIIVGILASNRNPELWGPDSYEWKPERWLNPLPETVIGAHLPGIYSHLMTFLGGGRACIGFKFSQLEMKVVLSLLLSSFRFSLPEKEVFWRSTGIYTPFVPSSGNLGSQLPLKVELIN